MEAIAGSFRREPGSDSEVDGRSALASQRFAPKISVSEYLGRLINVSSAQATLRPLVERYLERVEVSAVKRAELDVRRGEARQ